MHESDQSLVWKKKFVSWKLRNEYHMNDIK